MTDERAVSVAVTHTLTIGITTILISGLLIGAGGMLDSQTERAGTEELQTIGDRTANEIVAAADQGNRTNATVDIESQQPSNAIGGSYVLSLENRSDDEECRSRSGYDGCLVVSATQADRDAEIPIVLPDDVEIEESSATGGDVLVDYDPVDNGTIELQGEPS